MKRAVLRAPGRFEIEDAALPPLAEGEALVRVRAAGVCGSDLHLFRCGDIGGIRITDAKEPYVPGHECMGVVEDVAKGAEPALVGRRVFVEPAINCQRCRWCRQGRPNVCPHHVFLGLPNQRAGCLAEYVAHPIRLCEPLPEAIDDDAGLLMEPLAIAVHSLERMGVTGEPGESNIRGQPIVVMGAGTIGLTHVMLLASCGANPLIVTDVLDYRLELARLLGATHTFNPHSDDVVGSVIELCGGYGPDIVFECAGQMETFAQMIELAAPGGRVGVVGIPGEDRLTFPHSIARRKGLDVLMIRRACLTFPRALNWALRENLPLRTLTTHHWPLEKTQQAFETAAEYRDGVIKAVVNP